MSWTQVLADRPQVLEHLSTDFRHLELSALHRFRGNRHRIELYLAEAHDLTLREAGETLDDWLMFKSVHIEGQAAA